MDILKQLGELAIASRLRRLSERFVQDVALVYKNSDIDFEPRWFPVYYLLYQKAPLSIVDIAKGLGITHPAVNQIAGEMQKHGLVDGLKCENDGRKRLLSLTQKGLDLYETVKPLWDDIEVAARELTAATGYDVLAVMDRMERELDSRSFYSRISDQACRRQHQCIQIVAYAPEYKAYFKSLNLAWISKMFTVEAADERILSNPEEEILAPGGHILFALIDGEVLGTCAMVKTGEDSYELAKMAVREDAQGKHIGQKLLRSAISKAKAMGARVLTLESSSTLTPAIHLYRKMGFVSIPFDHPPELARANVRMMLDLEDEGACLETVLP